MNSKIRSTMLKHELITKRFINTTNLTKLKLKIPNIPKSVTPKRIVPDSTLSPYEISLITESEFVKGLYTLNTKTQVHPESYIPPKVEAISKYIPLLDGDLLPYKRPSTAPTPFEIIQLAQKNDNSGRVSVHSFPRLSVTKILTQQWCELRDFFEVYSRAQRVQTVAMKAGTESHLALELETHPEVDLTEIKKALPQVKLSKVDVEVSRRVEAIVRLVDLLQKGEAREIYVHGFIDEFGIVDHYDDVNDDKILVTGVIDHLILLAKDRSRPLETDFKQYDDLKDIVETGPEIINKYPDSYYCLVSDVKTRSRRSLPTQKSVLQSAKDQVMIYRKFLEILGDMGNPFLQHYCHRKGINIDEPISPEFTLELLCTYNIFIKDFEKLRDGESIGFKDFDSHVSRTSYDLTYLKSKIKDPETLSKLSPFLVKWSIPLTPRYFITRLSQLFHTVSLLLRASNLRIEYLYRGTLFEDINFVYDEEHMMNIVSSGYEFWTGMRDPVAVKGEYKEINTFCKYCEFKENCSWTKEIEAKSYQHGLSY